MIVSTLNNDDLLQFNFKKKEVSLDIDAFKIPKSIYNKTFQNLTIYNKVSFIISNKSKNGDCNWSIYTYAKNYKNKVHCVFSNELIDCKKLLELKKLYTVLNKIEKNSSIKTSEKYLNGYLEYINTTLEELMSQYLLTA